MGENYLVQEAMGVCRDIVGNMDKYAPWVWKEEEDEWKTNLDYCFLTLHLLCLLPLFTYICCIIFDVPDDFKMLSFVSWIIIFNILA
jgi:hypothetical protein